MNEEKPNDLTALITTAQTAGLATVYYYATAMVANGRFTLLAYEGLRPQVNVNPASVAALKAACEAAGIGCEEMRPERESVGIR